MRGNSVTDRAVEGLFRQVRLRALAGWLAGTAAGVLLMAVQANAQSAAPNSANTTGVGSSFESQFWASVDNASDPALYEAYLAKYPTGTFADLARIKITKLRSNAVPSQAAAPPALPQVTDTAKVIPLLGSIAQGASENSSGLRSGADASPVPASAAVPSNVIPVRSNQAMQSDQAEPLPGFPAPRPKQAAAVEAPYVTKAVPAESDAGESKLGVLLDAISPSGRMQSNQDSAANTPPPPPSAPLAERGPGPVASTQPQMQTGYGQVPTTQMPAPGPAYGTPAAAPGYQRPIAVGALPADFALPPRPILVSVPSVNFPDSFCSADARNAFHNNVYRPAVEAATRNNDLTGLYLRELQTIYDRYNLSGIAEPQNAVASESRAYKQVSDQAFFTQSALVSAFKALMAVPIVPCEAAR